MRSLERYRDDHDVEHVCTIRRILQRQDGRIDPMALGSYVAELGLQDEWTAVGAV